MREARQRGRDARVEVQVLPPVERYFGSWVLGLSLVRVVPPKTMGGGSSAPDGATDTKAWESRFFTFSLLYLRLLMGLILFVRTGRNGASCAWSRATELQAAPRRVGEYAAECGAVLGFAASAATSGAVGGQTNHTHGIGVGGPGGPDSDEMDEDGMGTDSDDIEENEEEDMDVNALAARMTIVFEGGHSGALPGYVLVARSHSLRTVLTTFVMNADSNRSPMRFGQPSCTRDACCLPLILQPHECASGNVLMTRAAMT